MNIGSINVALNDVYSLACQCLLLFCKNSTTNVLVVFMSWIIIYANCIFSLYTFPFAHSKDDDECGGNLIANGWIFNMPSLSTLFDSFYTSVFFNNSTSSSYLYVCSLFCNSFSFVVLYSFSMAFFAFMLLWTPKFQKHAQLPATKINCFGQLPFFFIHELLTHHIHFLTCSPYSN
jgi:hypothetical protein